MTAEINGIKVEGTAEEIAKLLNIRDSKKPSDKKPPEGVHYGVYDESGWVGDI